MKLLCAQTCYDVFDSNADAVYHELIGSKSDLSTTELRHLILIMKLMKNALQREESRREVESFIMEYEPILQDELMRRLQNTPGTA